MFVFMSVVVTVFCGNVCYVAARSNINKCKLNLNDSHCKSKKSIEWCLSEYNIMSKYNNTKVHWNVSETLDTVMWDMHCITSGIHRHTSD